MDEDVTKKIEELAFTFRRKGLATNMDEALDKARRIICTDVPSSKLSGDEKNVEQFFTNQPGTLNPSQPNKLDPDHIGELGTVGINAAATSSVSEDEPHSHGTTPHPVSTISEAGDLEIKNLLTEMDTDVVQYQQNHTNSPASTPTSSLPSDESYSLDEFFKEVDQMYVDKKPRNDGNEG